MEYFEKNDYTFHVVSAKRRKKSNGLTLKLTSMIDMFTILLVFLLKNFSAQGEIMAVSPDLKLPESTAQKPPQSASIIAVTEDVILMDGHQVATVREVLNSNQNLIAGLMNDLTQKRELSEKVGAISTNVGFTGKISIQGDKELPYLVIRKIMFTCGKVGFNDIMLAVTKPD